MRRTFGYLILALALGAASAAAQQKQPTYDDIYCSGQVTKESIPYDTYLISGEESAPKNTFSWGDYVYINKGSGDGVKVGDEFLVMRPVSDPAKIKWFESQPVLARAIGQQWLDVGRLRVVVLHPKVSIAQVVHTCGYLQRGDYVRPFAPRSAPTFAEGRIDHFEPVTGRPLGMVVNAKNYIRLVAIRDIIYVNLGSAQGVKEGDYFNIFRYQGMTHDKVYQIRGMQDRVYGFGSTPVRYNGKNDLPREILGEGIVLRVSENAAVVMITYSLKEIFMGDYVELTEPRRAPAAAAAPAAEPPAPAAPVNHPPSITVSADRTSVLPGERVRITARSADPDGDALTYAWRSSGGQVSGSGATVMLDTTGLAPGRYTVTGRVQDPQGAAADSSVVLSVEPPPSPPQASKMDEALFAPSSARLDNVAKRILDNVALRLQNEPRSRVLVVGYADSNEPNPDRLAGQRAENAKAYLVGRNIAESRVDTRVASGRAGAGRQNQRIDVIWVPEGATY